MIHKYVNIFSVYFKNKKHSCRNFLIFYFKTACVVIFIFEMEIQNNFKNDKL